MTHLRIKRLTPTAILPTRGSPGAIGLDLYFDDPFRPLEISPGNRAICKTGIAIAIPPGFYGRIAPRSGLAANKGIDVLAGVIDADYRGEICVVLLNTGDGYFTLTHGDRIAQLILERADIMPVVEVDDLDATERGAGGFGSSGSA
jgi:dUTP pyrophosphatase